MTKQIWLTRSYEPINNELLLKLQNSLNSNNLAYYVLPNARLVKRASKQYLVNNSNITYNGGFISLTVLVQRILKKHNINYTIIDKAMASVLVAKILLRLLEQQKLKYYNHFSNIEDMAPAILTTIKEIKHYYSNKANQLTLLPDMPLRYHDIMLVYHLYYQELLKNNLIDFEQATSLAVNLCKSDEVSFGGDLLVLAGLQYNKLQLDLVEQLVKKFTNIIVIMQANEKQDFFEREFSLIKHFINLGFTKRKLLNNNKHDLAQYLFTNEKNEYRQTVNIQGYNSKRLEAKHIIRKIKSIQLNNNIAAKDIVIVAKNTNEYSNLLSYYAEQAQVKLKTNVLNVAIHSMPIKLSLQLLKVQLSNWSADEFLSLLTNNYQFPSSINASLLADFIRITPSPGPLHNWINACRRQKNLCSLEQLTSEDSTILSYEQLAEIEASLLSIKKLYSSLPQQGSYQEHANALLNLIKNFGVHESILLLCNEVSQIEASNLIKSWSLFINMLKTHSQFSYLWPEVMSLNSFFIILQDVIKQQNVAYHNEVCDCVELLNAHKVAGNKYRYLFIVGFNDGKWPQRGKESWLQNISNDEIKLPLQAIKDYRKSEKLSFIRVLESATQVLNISYLLRNNEEKEMLASQYVSELMLTNNKCTLITKSIDLINKSHRLAYNEQELLLRNVLIKGLANNSYIDNRILIEKLRYNNEYSAYNGVISDTKIKTKLSSKFGDNAIYSTTMLEQYGKCPFSFYLHRVLKVKELEQLSIEVNPLIRGNIIHSVLASFLKSNSQLKLAEIENYEQQLKDLLNKQIVKMKNLLTDEGETWVLIESDRILYLLRLWLRNEIKLQECTNLLPSDFEYSFNKQHAVVLKSATNKLKVEGFIDRIDIGDEIIVVYDYKSGLAAKLQDIKDGVAFQIPFYCKAAAFKYPHKKIIGGGYYRIGADFNRKSGMWHADYLTRVNLSNRISDKVKPDDWLDLQNHVEELALNYQHNIINGNFKLTPQRPCPSFCPYKNICRMTPLLHAIVEAKRNEIYQESE
ncbi:PD-(D/E)XK nuclease family protein [Clostridium sp. 'deep sea']|uniref:PD-(D/E)XK nuclease family protein n=1 Tax=Clostridium sp. 'deep sea' TaxID=2779445 RepID=UPI00189663E4|nr:PD-(D/E)XK nuclease family protein [Clostridium sp. 'deep sea']QOR36554.1 PD-(D/E)XK nuclease family protein [Clostridium sp. 'deep sea']